MNFGVLPPEINSGLMYAGPGSGPVLAAAAAWNAIAAELRSAAMAYSSIVSGLTSNAWLGVSSAAMAGATARYAGWLAATAIQAEQTASQAKAAAGAYEAAFTMTVPPAVVAANRAQLAVLVATNVFGQNVPAIAATEAHYAEMWAQDAAAMYGYAGSAKTATELTPFATPPRTADSAAAASQAAGTTQAAGQAASSQLVSASLATPAQGIIPAELASVVPVIALAVSTSAASVNPSIAGSAWNAAAMNNRILIGNTQGILDNAGQLHIMEREILDILRSGRLSNALGAATPGGLGAGLTAAPVSAVTAQAVSAGKLSVPLSWAAAAPEMRTVAYALPGTSVGAAAAATAGTVGAAGGAGSAFSQMALAGMGGSALAGSVSRGQREHAGVTPEARMRSAVDEPAESLQEQPESPVAELAAGLRELGELRDSGLLTAREFNEQKERLLYRPLR